MGVMAVVERVNTVADGSVLISEGGTGFSRMETISKCRSLSTIVLTYR